MALDQYGGRDGMVGYDPKNDYLLREERDKRYQENEGLKSAGVGAVSGGAKGAAMGAQVAGPWGALAGGIAGLIGGGIGGGFRGANRAKEERKKQRAWNEAQKALARERYEARKRAHNLVKLSFSPANQLMKEMYGPNAGFDLEKTPWGPTGPQAVGPTTIRPGVQDSWSPGQYREPPSSSGGSKSSGGGGKSASEKPEKTKPPRRPSAR